MPVTSVSQFMRELRMVAEWNGWQIVEEVVAKGGSGANGQKPRPNPIVERVGGIRIAVAPGGDQPTALFDPLVLRLLALPAPYPLAHISGTTSTSPL
jgi:hypothetical protein